MTGIYTSPELHPQQRPRHGVPGRRPPGTTSWLLLALFTFVAVFFGVISLRAQDEPTPAPVTTPEPSAPAATPVPAATPPPAAEETPATTPSPEMTPAPAPTPVPAEPAATAPAPEPASPPAATPAVSFKPTGAEPIPTPGDELPSLKPTASPAVDVPRAETAPPAPVIVRPETGEPKTGEHPLDARDLEAFFDGLVPGLLLKDDAAGAAVCVVKDGQPLLTKGYGYADFKARKPVSGEETLFRPGSISKTFLAVAVMQLVEGGQLNLDRNVEEYLDFRLPARPYPQALTLRQLLTHTAGFEETIHDLALANDDPLISLRDYVQRNTPPQLYPPGTVPAYSNYGMSLAGYVVEKVSGQPFADYVATHIFGPLGMTHSSFAQPPPEPLAAAVSLGYESAGKPAIPFERLPPAPAGGLSASAADMGRFMLMLLKEGTLDDKRILLPESVKAFFERQHASLPALNALGLAFYTSTEGDHFIIGHAGDLEAFHSEFFLLPKNGVGMFLSVNSASGVKLRDFVRRAFLDRYFPLPPAPAPAPLTDTTKADARDAAGHYQSSRRIESDFSKFGDLAEQTAVNAPGDGTLTISVSKDLRGHLIQWEPVAGQRLLYRERGGPRLIAFERDARGRVNTLHGTFPGAESQRVPWYENQLFVLPFVLPSLALLLATALLWPVAGIVRRRYARPAVDGWTSRTFFVLTRVVCVLDALAIAGWLCLFGFSDDLALFNGHHLRWQLPALYILGRIGAAGGVVVLAGALVFLHPKFTVRRHIRWQQWLLVAACAVFALFAWHWHLLA